MIRAVIFDWAGTTVDCGSHAPVGVFVEAFGRRGVAVTVAEARGPMGVHKREHVRQVLAMPRVRAAWRQLHGEPTAADVDAVYEDAKALQIACIVKYSDPIPGVLDVVGRLRARGIRIGSTTGYVRAMLDVLEPVAAAKGWCPEVAIAADEAPAGRPAPFLIWAAAARLGVFPASACVNVGDTVVDVQSGRNAGMWSIGVALTGNEAGLTAEELERTVEADKAAIRSRATEKLTAAGAHLVIDSVADLETALEEVDRRIESGERP